MVHLSRMVRCARVLPTYEVYKLACHSSMQPNRGWETWEGMAAVYYLLQLYEVCSTSFWILIPRRQIKGWWMAPSRQDRLRVWNLDVWYQIINMPDLDVRKIPLLFLRIYSRKSYLQRQSGAKGTGFISEKQWSILGIFTQWNIMQLFKKDTLY